MAIERGVKIVELRRHSKRNPEGGLSEEGRALAQAASSTMEGPYDKAYSSPSRRAMETLQAFGYARFEVDVRLGPLPSEKLTPYDEAAKQLRQTSQMTLLEAYFFMKDVHPILVEKGRAMIEAIQNIASSLPDGGRALAVSHGGSIEPAILLALRRRFSLNVIGEELRECEGTKFYLAEDKIMRIDIVRLVS